MPFEANPGDARAVFETLFVASCRALGSTRQLQQDAAELVHLFLADAGVAESFRHRVDYLVQQGASVGC